MTTHTSTAEEEFSKCNFILTEINHDLKPPIGRDIQKNHNFKQIYKIFLDNDESGCHAFAFNNYNFFDDAKIVTKILGISKTSLIDETLKTYNTMQKITVTTIDNIKKSNTKSIKSEANIIKCNKTLSGYTNDLFSIFRDCHFSQSSDGFECDLFFVIDTGDELVQKLKKLTPETETRTKYNINIMHSQFTLGDSAPKTLPDSPNYTISNSFVNLYSWYLTENLTIPRNNKLFMSDIHIQCQLYKNGGWKVRQDWYAFINNNAKRVYQTFDSKKENSKPLVRNYLSQHLDELKSKFELTTKEVISDTITNIETLDPTLNKIVQIKSSLNILKKRSGDHGQVAYCNDLINRYLKSSDKFIKIRSSVKDNDSYMPFMQLDQENKYKKNTFFLTGDWPCFAFCIYNKINAIMVYKDKIPTKSCIIKISFIR